MRGGIFLGLSEKGGDLSIFFLSLRTIWPVVLHLHLPLLGLEGLEDQEQLFSYIFHPLILKHIYSVSTGFEGLKNFLVFRQDSSMILSLQQYLFVVRVHSTAGILLCTFPTNIMFTYNESVCFSKVNVLLINIC